MALTIPTTPPPIASPQEIDRYEFELDGRSFTVVMAGSDDPRKSQAREIEVDTFSRIGDDPEEVRVEFLKYEEASVYMFLHATQDTAEDTDSSQLLGMGRFIPYVGELGLKTFNDLGEIAANARDTDSMSSILGSVGLSGYSADFRPDAEVVSTRVEEEFKKVYGCIDLTRAVDVSTLAPEMSLPKREKFAAIEALLTGMSFYVTDLFRTGNATHLVQFTEKRMHDFLIFIGHPMRELFGLSPMFYDSNGTGPDSSMCAVPSVLLSSELNDAFFADNPATDHMANIKRRLLERDDQH